MLRSRLANLQEANDFPQLTIFGAGSYARLEASQYSDIDVFFLSGESKKDIHGLRTKSLQLFGKVIGIGNELGFPKFSNDCEYLVILHTDDILSHLGGRTDDHENYFTARMLLLLESQCLYGQGAYDEITSKIVNSYFVDYPDHRQTFQPMFLLNDICRFWKTLLLNYENKRNIPRDGPDAEKLSTKQKVRNFKLKFSRMTTCFASIAALGSHLAPVTQEQVIQLTRLTPRQRLKSITQRMPQADGEVREVIDRYIWFLEMTGLPTEQLEENFSDKQKRTQMFERANSYGDSMFKLLQKIDEAAERPSLIRTLVI